MSDDSLAMSTASSTLMPTSARRSAGASLIPSPRKPTTWPLARRQAMTRSLCRGLSLAKIVVDSTAAPSSLSVIASISAPVSVPRTFRPTISLTCLVTASLSPVRILISICDASSSRRASVADSFGGSRNARKPSRVISASSACVIVVCPTGMMRLATATSRKPCSLSPSATERASVGTLMQPSSTSSIAPLQMSSGGLPGCCSRTDRRRRIKSNGCSSSLLHC